MNKEPGLLQFVAAPGFSFCKKAGRSGYKKSTAIADRAYICKNRKPYFRPPLSAFLL